MGFNGKRSETEKTEHGNETSKLMIGMVDKRKPGMEFLGKRWKLYMKKYFFSILKGLTIQFTVTDLETDFQDIFKKKCVVTYHQITKTDWLDFTFNQPEF